MTKTLREMMDVVDGQEQLDEGWKSALAGAALAGTMAVGALSPAAHNMYQDTKANITHVKDNNFVKSDGLYVDQMLKLYTSAKLINAQNHDSESAAVMQQAKTLIQQTMQKYPKLKPVIDREYQLVQSNYQSDLSANPDQANQSMQASYNNRDRIFSNYDAWLNHGQDPVFAQPKSEFNESTLSESIDLAIAHLNELLK